MNSQIDSGAEFGPESLSAEQVIDLHKKTRNFKALDRTAKAKFYELETWLSMDQTTDDARLANAEGPIVARPFH